MKNKKPTFKETLHISDNLLNKKIVKIYNSILQKIKNEKDKNVLIYLFFLRYDFKNIEILLFFNILFFNKNKIIEEYINEFDNEMKLILLNILRFINTYFDYYKEDIETINNYKVYKWKMDLIEFYNLIYHLSFNKKNEVEYFNAILNYKLYFLKGIQNRLNRIKKMINNNTIDSDIKLSISKEITLLKFKLFDFLNKEFKKFDLLLINEKKEFEITEGYIEILNINKFILNFIVNNINFKKENSNIKDILIETIINSVNNPRSTNKTIYKKL